MKQHILLSWVVLFAVQSAYIVASLPPGALTAIQGHHNLHGSRRTITNPDTDQIISADHIALKKDLASKDGSIYIAALHKLFSAENKNEWAEGFRSLLITIRVQAENIKTKSEILSNFLLNAIGNGMLSQASSTDMRIAGVFLTCLNASPKNKSHMQPLYTTLCQFTGTPPTEIEPESNKENISTDQSANASTITAEEEAFSKKLAAEKATEEARKAALAEEQKKKEEAQAAALSGMFSKAQSLAELGTLDKKRPDVAPADMFSQAEAERSRQAVQAEAKRQQAEDAKLAEIRKQEELKRETEEREALRLKEEEEKREKEAAAAKETAAQMKAKWKELEAASTATASAGTRASASGNLAAIKQKLETPAATGIVQPVPAAVGKLVLPAVTAENKSEKAAPTSTGSVSSRRAAFEQPAAAVLPLEPAKSGKRLVVVPAVAGQLAAIQPAQNSAISIEIGAVQGGSLQDRKNALKIAGQAAPVKGDAAIILGKATTAHSVLAPAPVDPANLDSAKPVPKKITVNTPLREAIAASLNANAPGAAKLPKFKKTVGPKLSEEEREKKRKDGLKKQFGALPLPPIPKPVVQAFAPNPAAVEPVPVIAQNAPASQAGVSKKDVAVNPVVGGPANPGVALIGPKQWLTFKKVAQYLAIASTAVGVTWLVKLYKDKWDSAKRLETQAKAQIESNNALARAIEEDENDEAQSSEYSFAASAA